MKIKTKYDYWQGKHDVLSKDGKKADILIGFQFSTSLMKIGEMGRLKGKALLDFKSMKLAGVESS